MRKYKLENEIERKYGIFFYVKKHPTCIQYYYTTYPNPYERIEHTVALWNSRWYKIFDKPIPNINLDREIKNLFTTP
jgi:hypothetical protein